MSIVYAGLWVEPEKCKDFDGLSIAGNNFQERFLEDLASLDITLDGITSVRPTLSYPKQKLFWGHEESKLKKNIIYIPYINYSIFKFITQGLSFIYYFKKIIYKKTANKKNILISYNLSHPQGIFLFLTKTLFNYQWVVLLADFPGVAISHDSGLLRKIAFGLEKFFLKKSDAVILLNPCLLKNYPLPQRSITILPTPPSDILIKLKKITPRNSRECVIYYGGRLDKVRGILSLLKAIRILPKESRIKVRFTGDGPLLDSLLNEKSDRIVYLGKKSSQDEIFEIYSQVDALINPHETSTDESLNIFPSKLIEQLSTGVPVISTKIGGVENTFKMSLYLDNDSPLEIMKGLRKFELGDKSLFLEEARINKDYIHSGCLSQKHQNELKQLLESL